MGRKVLISFLGTGPNNKTKQRQERQYRPANYVFKDFNTDTISKEDAFETSFVADALVKKYDIDSIILLGTVHSMWERVYEVFCENKNLPVDDAYYCNLADHCDNADHRSELSIPSPEKIEKVLGESSHILLLKYGLNDAEIAYNTQVILGIEKLLQKGDELYLDITHSFRSLPIYLMNCLIFLNNVSKKQVSIKSISYGMLDVSTEYPTGKKNDKGDFCEFYTPVVDLKKLIEVQEWITGAYNFIEFGNAYKMAKLLEADKSANYKKAAKGLRKFADLKNLNRLSEFRKEIDSLKPLMNSEMLPPIGQLMIPDIIDSFTKRFSANLTDYTYKYRMAEWHEKHHNYGYAFINLVEAALSYCCELVPDSNVHLQQIMNSKSVPKRKAIGLALSFNDSIDRNKKKPLADNFIQLRTYLKEMMKSSDIEFSQFNMHYDKIDFDRNTLSHVLEREKPKDFSDSIKELKEGLKYFSTIFQT